MSLSSYITTQLRELGLKRGDLPRLLGYTNPNKCLRNLDHLLSGDFNQTLLIQRIQESPIGGETFLSELDREKNKRRIDQQEREKVQELKDRKSFVPHLHFIHERNVPSPIHVVCFIGVNHFKRLELPDYVFEITDEDQRVQVVEGFLRDYLLNPPTYQYINSVFGRVRQILYRIEYDRSWVFEVSENRFIGEHQGVPRMGVSRLDVSGRRWK